ncbi:hypothetical protein V1599_12425 [Enterobacter sp. ECC-175]|uniref:hypothetical protein n=1 Tax=Enterobacter sp. ECC-175 TaxID=3116479 RepID=UPI003754C4D3
MSEQSGFFQIPIPVRIILDFYLWDREMKKFWLVIILLVAGFTLTSLKNHNSSPDTEAASDKSADKSKERYAIQYCWEQYDRKSLNADEKRFIAGSCEKMEAKFKDKYGVKP